MSSRTRQPVWPADLALASRYAAFAAMATLVNLAAQMVSLSLYTGPLHLGMALVIGTIAGLLPKYLLDKRWIFADPSGGLRNHARKLTIYTTMSLATTLIFWTTEILFDRLGHGGRLHYAGAVLGLALGYWAKYHLDRRFTFPAAPEAGPGVSFASRSLVRSPPVRPRSG